MLICSYLVGSDCVHCCTLVQLPFACPTPAPCLHHFCIESELFSALPPFNLGLILLVGFATDASACLRGLLSRVVAGG